MAKCEPNAAAHRSVGTKASLILLLLIEKKVTVTQWINLQRNEPSYVTVLCIIVIGCLKTKAGQCVCVVASVKVVCQSKKLQANILNVCYIKWLVI